MKSVMKFFVMMLVSSSLVLSGCKKDEKEDPKPTYTNVLTAKVGGTAFSASTPIAQMGMGILQIGGANAAGSMQVLMSYDVKVGTYPITADSEEAVYWDSGNDSYWPGTGSIVVTKHDEAGNIIEGTFKANLKEFSTSAPLEITDGVFKINYTEH